MAEARQKLREKMTDAEKLTGRLMGLKFRMEDYFWAEKPNNEYSFGYFLKLYIELLDMKRRGFSDQIGIDETVLSQLVNQRGHLLNIYPFGLNYTPTNLSRLNISLRF